MVLNIISVTKGKFVLGTPLLKFDGMFDYLLDKDENTQMELKLQTETMRQWFTSIYLEWCINLY